MKATILDRDVYSEAEAARLLRVAPSTLHYWLEGGERRGRLYPPILRPEPKGSRLVSWAEFVEAGLLRGYRRDLAVPMAQLRQFIEVLRSEYGVPYPLAHERPWVSGKQLVMQAQEESDLASDFWLVYEAKGQLLLTATGQEFLRRVDFVDDLAAAWRPHEDEASPVRVDPLHRAGRPNVRGIATEAVWEHVEAGEEPADVADDFALTLNEVNWALAYELSARAS